MVLTRVSISAAKKHLRIPEAAATFNVYPEGKRALYFRCLVFRTQPQLQRYAGFHGITECPLSAAVRPFDEGRCAGEICMCLFHCTDSTLAHEIFHAAAWWAKRMRFLPSTALGCGHATHERMAEAVGGMNSDFWREFTAAGFKRTECWQ